MRVLAVCLALLVAACLGPDRERVACGDYPFVLVTSSFVSWQAESGADWLLRQPEHRWPLLSASTSLIDFFEPGQPVTIIRRSDRFTGLSLVRHHENRMWTADMELIC